MTVYNLTSTNVDFALDGGIVSGVLYPGQTNLPVRVTAAPDWGLRLTYDSNILLTVTNPLFTEYVVAYADALDGNEVKAEAYTGTNEMTATVMTTGLVAGITLALFLKAISMLKFAKPKRT